MRIAPLLLTLTVVGVLACSSGETKSPSTLASNEPAAGSTPTASGSLSPPLPSLPACKIVPSLAPGVATADLLAVAQATDVPAGARTYLAIWEGFWGGQDPSTRSAASVFVVQSIAGAKVRVTYIFQGVLQRNATDWELTPDNKLRYVNDTTAANGSRIEFTMNLTADGKLHGERIQTNNGIVAAGSPAIADLERCVVAPAR